MEEEQDKVDITIRINYFVRALRKEKVRLRPLDTNYEARSVCTPVSTRWIYYPYP
jgi:hypothetical protein